MPKVVPKVSGRSVDCPTTFEPKKTNYKHWHKEAQVWCQVTNYPKRKHELLVFLAMRGTAKDSVFQINKDILGLKDGFEKVLTVLDELYMPEIFEKKYQNFYDLRGESVQTVFGL